MKYFLQKNTSWSKTRVRKAQKRPRNHIFKIHELTRISYVRNNGLTSTIDSLI